MINTGKQLNLTNNIFGTRKYECNTYCGKVMSGYHFYWDDFRQCASSCPNVFLIDQMHARLGWTDCQDQYLIENTLKFLMPTAFQIIIIYRGTIARTIIF